MHIAAGDADETCLDALAGHLNHAGVGASGFGDGLDLIGNMTGLGNADE